MKQKVHAFLSRQHMMTNDFEIYHYKDKKIRNVALHQHDFYEVFYYISGTVHYLIEGRTYELTPGDIILVNTRELHQAIINQEDGEYERIVLWLSPDYLKNLSTQETDLTRCFEDSATSNLIKLEFEDNQKIKSILYNLIDLEGFEGFGHDLYDKVYITELMLKLNSLSKGKNEVFSANTKESPLIDKVIDYIEAHLEDEMTIDMLAETFFLSKYHLSREFKKYTGITIHRYIILKRLIIAKELIMQNYAITDVYIQCGFGDYSNFFRAFKNEYGITPKQYHSLISQKVSE